MEIGFASIAARQKIVDALTGVISHQAVLPNRFCVARLAMVGMFGHGEF